MAHPRPIRNGIPRLFSKPTRTTRARLLYAALLTFGLRALIPLGFMPAADGTLSLMICPGGLPAGFLSGQTDRQSGPGMGHGMAMSGAMPMPQAHQASGQGHGPGQGAMDEGYCAFTTGFSSAPPPLLLTALFLILSCVAVIAVTVLAPAGLCRVHVPQARAPPAPC